MFIPNPCAPVHSLMKFSVWLCCSMTGRWCDVEQWLLPVEITWHPAQMARWFGGLNATHSHLWTFVFGSRLCAQTEPQLHTLYLNSCISQIFWEIQKLCSHNCFYIPVLFIEIFFKFLSLALFSLMPHLRETGNRRGWEENPQWLAPFDTGNALCVPYSAKPLCTKSSFFMRCLWGQPRPVPSPACTSSNISSFWWMTIWGAQWPYWTWIICPVLFCSSIFKCPSSPTLWVNVLWSLQGTSALA